MTEKPDDLPTHKNEFLNHNILQRMSPDGCCHKTRIKGFACPVGWTCPFDKEKIKIKDKL